MTIKYQEYNMETEDPEVLQDAMTRHYARYLWTDASLQFHFRAMADMFDEEMQAADMREAFAALSRKRDDDEEGRKRCLDWLNDCLHHQNNAIYFFAEAERTLRAIQARGYHCIKRVTKDKIDNKFAEMALKHLRIHEQREVMLNV